MRRRLTLPFALTLSGPPSGLVSPKIFAVPLACSSVSWPGDVQLIERRDAIAQARAHRPCALSCTFWIFMLKGVNSAVPVICCGFAAGPLTVIVPLICDVALMEPGAKRSRSFATFTPASVIFACVA